MLFVAAVAAVANSTEVRMLAVTAAVAVAAAGGVGAAAVATAAGGDCPAVAVATCATRK